jgi:hypothetical protein
VLIPCGNAINLRIVSFPILNGGFTRGADKSLARPTSPCIFSDGENISFDAGHVIYINSTNIPPIMIINMICCCLLFSWRYNPLWLYFHSPVAGFSLLVFEVS